jgi:hypothetical protein
MDVSHEQRVASGKAKFALQSIFRADQKGNPEGIDHARVAQLIAEIPEDELPEFMFSTAVTGNTRLMHALQTLRGPIVVDYANDLEQGHSTLNGKNFKPFREYVLGHCQTAADLKAFFALVKAYGIKGLFEPGPAGAFLFQKAGLTDVRDAVKSASFLGDLPFLSAGTINSPELAICLSQESLDSVTPEIFQPMLCWATEAMVNAFPDDLIPLRPLQMIDYAILPPLAEHTESDLERYECIPAATFKSNARPNEEAVILEVTFGFERHEKQSEWAGNLERYMGNVFTHHGFADPDGRVLCEARADFLLSFPVAFCTEENLLESKRFIKHYFPIDILALQTLKICEEVHGHPYTNRIGSPLTFSYRNDRNGLFEKLGKDNVLHDRMMDMLTREQWLGLIRHAGLNSLTAETFIVLRDNFDLDNQGLCLTLVPCEIDTYSAAGFRFVDNTVVFQEVGPMADFHEANPGSSCVCIDLTSSAIRFTLKEDSPEKVLAEAVRLHGLAQSMNLWSSQGIKPENTQQALSEIMNGPIDKPNVGQGIALRAYLVNQGLAACAKEATSSEEWILLTQIFSEAEIHPYLSIMPRKARGRVLESQLGL